MDYDALVSGGLTAKSARIYLAGLSLGTTSIQELARKTNLKRPTVYLHMDELLSRGLFAKVSLNGKEYYRASPPQVLESQVRRHLVKLQNIMPKLRALQANTLGKPQVQVYEGKEGVERIYEELVNANSWRVWSNLGNTYKLLGNTFEKISQAVHEGGIGVKEIIEDTKESRRYSKLLAHICGPTYSGRVATVGGIENDTFIYGNCVAIFRLHEFNMFVVRIEDKTIADSMKAMFDMAWKSAKPLR